MNSQEAIHRLAITSILSHELSNGKLSIRGISGNKVKNTNVKKDKVGPLRGNSIRRFKESDFMLIKVIFLNFDYLSSVYSKY